MRRLAEVLIEGVTENVSGRGRVDAIKIDHVQKLIIVRELKPATTKAFDAANGQLNRYIQAMTTDGRVVGNSERNFRTLHFEQGYQFVKDFPTYDPFP